MPSSTQLVENTSKWFKDYDTVLMANHGIVAGASDIQNAFFKIETAETYAKTYIFSKIIENQAFLNDNEIKQLEELRAKIFHKN